MSVQSTLKTLDERLADTNWKGPPSDLSHLAEAAHLESFKCLGKCEETISKWIVGKANQLINGEAHSEFRVCSIGCTDGTFDCLFMEEVAKKHPSLTIQYTGIDADDQACELAEEKVGSLASNITAEAVSEDYQELRKEDFSPFDLIVMVNPQLGCIYDGTEVEPILSGAVQLVKPKGELVIVSSSRQSFNELIARFWKHQRNHDLYTTEFITKALQKMAIKYKVFQEPLSFDLTQCFMEKFETLSSQNILDHLMFVRLADYHPDISQLCVDYLEAIAQEKPEKYLVTSLCDMIVINGAK